MGRASNSARAAARRCLLILARLQAGPANAATLQQFVEAHCGIDAYGADAPRAVRGDLKQLGDWTR
jgi:hypothetical protein